MTTVQIHPTENVRGILRAPGSKSMGNRALLLAALVGGTSTLRGILDADDTDAALAALAALGVRCERAGAGAGDEITVHGCGGIFPADGASGGEINIRSSGTVGRFLPGLLAGTKGGLRRIAATPQLAARPIAPLLAALRQWGADIRQPIPDKSFPLEIMGGESGGTLTGGKLTVSAKSSTQFASGALLAAPLCRAAATVVITDLDPEEAYIDMTLDLLRSFGIATNSEKHSTNNSTTQTVTIPAPQMFRPVDMTIEADANTAMYFLALAALTGGEVTVSNLPQTSRQPGMKFLDILARLGAKVKARSDGDGITVAGGALPLRGGFTLDMRPTAEMALTLGVLAVFADAPITMTNLAHIRGHESDRLAALAQLLAQVGVRTEETADSITVHPADRRNIAANPVIDPRDDHRLAMSFALLGAAANGVTITNPDCVAKTCPDFFDRVAGLGVQISTATA